MGFLMRGIARLISTSMAIPTTHHTGTMRIAIAGGTGFLGKPLGERLSARGHHVVNLARGQADVDGMDAAINLAGESIAGRRWTKAQKQRILDSRVLTTRTLVDAIARAAAPPAVFISGSAVGY